MNIRVLLVDDHAVVRDGLRALLERLTAAPPQRVLEIGTSKGGTLYLFCRVATPTATLVTVDLPGAWLRGHYPRWKDGLYRSFAGPQQTVVTMGGDSHSAATARQVESCFGGQPIDFLFIDGDHSYDACKADIAAWAPFARRGGVMAFHDFGSRAEGVTRAIFEEIRAGRFAEIVGVAGTIIAFRMQ